MPTAAVTHVMVTNTLAESNKVNQNFSDLVGFLNGQIGASNIAAGGVGSANIAGSAVTTGLIASGAVTATKLAAEAVGSAALAPLSVTAAKIALLAVGSAQLADLGVTTGKIAELAVTAAKLANASVSTLKMGIVSAAKVHLSTGQVVPNNVETVIGFGTGAGSEEFDTDGYHDMTTNPSKFTVPAGYGGLFLLEAAATFVGDTTGMTRELTLYKGVIPIAQDQNPPTTSGANNVRQVSCVVRLEAGDTIEMKVKHDAGNDLTMMASQAFYTFMTIVRLGAKGV